MNKNTASRREQIAELRALHRRMGRRHGYAKLAATAAAVNLLLAWMLMITIGILHAGWWRVVPTMGYGTASLVIGLLSVSLAGAVIIIIQTARDFS